MIKSPNYESASKELAEECASDPALEAARQEIFKALTESVQIIKKHRLSSDENVSIKACKEHLTLAGLYVDKDPKKVQPTIQVFLPEVKSE